MLKLIFLLVLVCFSSSLFAKNENGHKTSAAALHSQYTVILNTAKIIQSKLLKNAAVDTDLKKLQSIQKFFDRQKLLAVTALAKNCAVLKEKGTKEQILE